MARLPGREFHIPILLLVFYSLDIASTYMLDPTLMRREMNPFARQYGWAYALPVSALFASGLSYWWIWSIRNAHFLGRIGKDWKKWFVSTFSGKGYALRYLVVFGAVLPPSSVAMKAVMVANNVTFIFLTRLMSFAQNAQLRDALGGIPYNQFHRGLFALFMALALVAGASCAWHYFRELANRLK